MDSTINLSGLIRHFLNSKLVLASVLLTSELLPDSAEAASNRCASGRSVLKTLSSRGSHDWLSVFGNKARLTWGAEAGCPL